MTASSTTLDGMTIEDIPRLLEIEHICFPVPWSGAMFVSQLGLGDIAINLVLREEGSIIGYAIAWAAAREIHLLSIAIMPEKRGRGLADKLLEEVRGMRARMRSELGTRGAPGFDIKQDAGGITDIEFMVQYAALRWGARLGTHLRFTDNIRLLEGLEAVGLLSADDAALLNRAYKAYRERMHRLSLQQSPGIVEVEAFAAFV